MNILLNAAITLSLLLPITAAIAQSPTSTSPAPVAVEGKSSLTVSFSGLETQKGAILLSVYDSEAAFDRGGKPVRDAMVPASAAAVSAVIAGLPAGRYAIKAFHDIDGDMKMAANPFGMPTEPFAFSNNAVANMGPAKWVDAAFSVTDGANRHAITIR